MRRHSSTLHEGLHRPTFFADRWTSVRGAKLHSVEAAFPGRIPFVLVPGLAMSGAYFLPLARVLAESHPVRVLELPGFGRSSGPKQALSMREHADWLCDWMQARGLSTCHLVGHSMGCQVAAHLAAAEPERVRTLTLIGPTVDAYARVRTRQILRLTRDLSTEPWPVLFHALVDVLRAGVAHTWRTSTEMLADPLEAQLARITAPTLLLRGAKDPIAPEEWLRTASEFLVAGQWRTLSAGAHCVQFSDPVWTATAITALVGNVEAKGNRVLGESLASRGQNLREHSQLHILPSCWMRFLQYMKIITLVSLAALCLTACDSKQEELRKAELENRADKLEEAAKATKKAAEGDAAVVKKQGEAQAEALKNAADKARDQK